MKINGKKPVNTILHWRAKMKTNVTRELPFQRGRTIPARVFVNWRGGSVKKRARVKTERRRVVARIRVIWEERGWSTRHSFFSLAASVSRENGAPFIADASFTAAFR